MSPTPTPTAGGLVRAHPASTLNAVGFPVQQSTRHVRQVSSRVSEDGVHARAAGVAGIITAVCLVGEFLFFGISGYRPDTFPNGSSAVAFLGQGIGFIQLAVVFGIVGVLARTIYVIGLARHVGERAPTLGASTKYFGLLGGIGHGVVAISFFIALPMIVGVASTDPTAAAQAWVGFHISTSVFQVLGNLLLGLALLSLGIAALRYGAFSKGLGATALACGAVTTLGSFIAGTSLASVGFLLFLPAIVLAIVVDAWAGILLLRTSATHGVVAA